jgi:hypothetical protein
MREICEDELGNIFCRDQIHRTSKLWEGVVNLEVKF